MVAASLNTPVKIVAPWSRGWSFSTLKIPVGLLLLFLPRSSLLYRSDQIGHFNVGFDVVDSKRHVVYRVADDWWHCFPLNDWMSVLVHILLQWTYYFLDLYVRRPDTCWSQHAYLSEVVVVDQQSRTTLFGILLPTDHLHRSAVLTDNQLGTSSVEMTEWRHLCCNLPSPLCWQMWLLNSKILWARFRLSFFCDAEKMLETVRQDQLEWRKMPGQYTDCLVIRVPSPHWLFSSWCTDGKMTEFP